MCVLLVVRFLKCDNLDVIYTFVTLSVSATL